MKHYEKLYESQFQKILINTSDNILKNIWLTKNIEMDDMQNEMRQWMNFFEKYHPKSIITDNREANQVLIPEVQNWLVSFLFPKIVQMGLKKWAVLVTNDLFSNVSVEQMLDDGKAVISNAEFTQSLFEDTEAAERWLTK